MQGKIPLEGAKQPEHLDGSVHHCPQVPHVVEEKGLANAVSYVQSHVAHIALQHLAESPITPEKEVITLLSNLDIPSVVKKEGECGAQRIAQLLVKLRAEGYGDYLAVYNIFSNLNLYSRREYLELWQTNKRQLLQVIDEYIPSTEDLLEKACCEEAREEFAKMEQENTARFTQLLETLKKMVAIHFVVKKHYTNEMNRFRQGQAGDNFDCDEQLLFNQSLALALGIVVLPEMSINEHVCQDIPDTNLVLDWGRISTKRELLQAYKSDYFATECSYATANYNQCGKVSSYSYSHNQHSYVQPNEAIAIMLGRQKQMFAEQERPVSRSAVQLVSEKLSPDARYVRCQRVSDVLNANKIEEAIAMLNQWLEKDPANVDYLDYLARAYLQQQRIAEAMSTFKIILQRYPNNLDQVDNVYNAFMNTREYAKARCIIERYMPKNITRQQRAYVQHQLGYAFAMEGNTAEALRLFEEAMNLDPAEELYKRNIVKLKRSK